MADGTQERDLDLGLAAALQAALLPRECPVCRKFMVAAKNRMCRSIGGDFYDFIPLNEDQVAIVIGDVIGHGVQAALLIAQIMGWLRSNSGRHSRPTRVVEDLNLMLVDLGRQVDTTLLCSIFYSVLDLPSGLMMFVNAGHPSPILFDRTRSRAGCFSPTSILLGIQPMQPEEDCHRFSSGERLVLFTDGVPDATNADQEPFGEMRLQEAVQTRMDLPPKELTEAVFAEVDAFRGQSPFQDDETLVVVDYVYDRDGEAF